MGLQQGARPVQAWTFRQQPGSEPRCYRGSSIVPSLPPRRESPAIDQSSLGKLGSMGLKPMNPRVGHPGVRNACKVCSTNTSPSASKTAGSFPGGANKRNTRRRPTTSLYMTVSQELTQLKSRAKRRSNPLDSVQWLVFFMINFQKDSNKNPTRPD